MRREWGQQAFGQFLEPDDPLGFQLCLRVNQPANTGSSAWPSVRNRLSPIS